MSDVQCVKHVKCGAEVILRRRGQGTDEEVSGLALFCPNCRSFVDESELNDHGPFCAAP